MSGALPARPPAAGGWRSWRVGTLAAAQVINLAAVLAVVRIYPAAAYGWFAVLFAVATIVAGVSALRLDIAVTTATEQDATALVRVARRLNLTVGVATALVGLGWSVIAGRADTARLVEVVALGATVAGLGLSNTMSYACVRDQRYDLVAASRLVTAVTAAGGQLGLGLYRPVPGTLLAASALGYLAGVLVLRLGRTAAAGGGVGDREVLRRHRGFMTASAPAGLLNSLTLNLPVLITAAAVGGVAAADLALALRIGLLPLALLGQALMPVLFGAVARQVREEPAAAPASYDRALGWLTLTGTGCLGVLSWGVYATAERLLGPQWSGVGTVLLMLAPFMIAQFAAAPLSQTLNALGRNREQLAWDVARLAAVSAAFLPVVAGWAALPVSLVAFSAVMVAAYTAHVALTRRALRERADRRASREPRPVDTGASA